MPLNTPQTITLVCLAITAAIFLVYATIEILYCRWRNKPSPRTRGMKTVGVELERAKKKRVRTGANNIPLGTRIWAIWDKEPWQSKRGAREQKNAERLFEDWVERGEGVKSTTTPGKPGRAIKSIRLPSASPALEWEIESEDTETEPASQYSLGWTYPLPELVRDGKKGGKLVDEEKGWKGKKGKRVPGS